MYLGNPLLPINYTAEQARAEVAKELGKKFWREYEISPLKLTLVPYFLFNYHYFLEKSQDGEKVIKDSVDGLLAIDGHDIVVKEDAAELIKDNMKKLSTSAPPRVEFSEKWCNIEKKEQDEVLRLKSAQYFNVPKTNVVISSAKKVFMPFYKGSAKVGKQSYELIFNALEGSIEWVDEVPEREKGAKEVAKETLNDLKSPKNWLAYSKEMVKDAGKAASKRSSKKVITSTVQPAEKSAGPSNVSKALAILESRPVLFIIIVLALFVIYLALFQ